MPRTDGRPASILPQSCSLTLASSSQKSAVVTIILRAGCSLLRGTRFGIPQTRRCMSKRCRVSVEILAAGRQESPGQQTELLVTVF